MSERDVQPPAASTILVVEDDDATRNFYEDLLMMEGYRVVSAATGHLAMVQVAAQSMDAIVLDYRLPDATGEQVCRQIRTVVASNVPILMVTADQSPGLEAEARAAGATAFLRNLLTRTSSLDGSPHLFLPRRMLCSWSVFAL